MPLTEECCSQDFIREVLLIWNIRHKFILPVYGATSIRGSNCPCLAMRWMANETALLYLCGHRDQANRMVSFRCRFQVLMKFLMMPQLIQIAQALSYLHAHDVVHADLRGVCYRFILPSLPRLTTTHRRMSWLTTRATPSSQILDTQRSPTRQCRPPGATM